MQRLCRLAGRDHRRPACRRLGGASTDGPGQCTIRGDVLPRESAPSPGARQEAHRTLAQQTSCRGLACAGTLHRRGTQATTRGCIRIQVLRGSRRPKCSCMVVRPGPGHASTQPLLRCSSPRPARGRSRTESWRCEASGPGTPNPPLARTPTPRNPTARDHPSTRELTRRLAHDARRP
jgi:hypothetical protein